jgi:hypothetical protein
MITLQEQLNSALLEAREQDNSPVLWDIVEEISAAIEHKKRQKTNLQIFCLNNPDAPECRAYDI